MLLILLSSFFCCLIALMYNRTRQLQESLLNLREAHEKIETIMKVVPAGIFQATIESDCLYVNLTWCLFTGLSSQEALGQGWKVGLHPEDRPRVEEAWREAVKSGAAMQLLYRYQAHGEWRWIQTKAVPHFDEGGKISSYYGASTDVTAQKKADAEREEYEKLIEEQRVKIIHSEKMGALGEMAGGIAHEINNPLAVIELNASQLKMKLVRGERDLTELSKYSDRISNTVQRIAKIVRGLKTFARDGENDPFEAACVEVLIREAFEFCQTRFVQESVDFQMNPIPEGFSIQARAVQLSQVFLNLLNNAFDAVVATPNPWVRVEVLDMGEMVQISIIDSGTGISPDVAAKIMQPFFTTKEVGKGTGLGLSVSQALIKGHGGSLVLDSLHPNTCFRVVLPKFQDEVKKAS